MNVSQVLAPIAGGGNRRQQVANGYPVVRLAYAGRVKPWRLPGNGVVSIVRSASTR